MNTFHPPAGAQLPGQPLRIDPDAFYTDADLRIRIGCTHATLRDARRRGLLRFSRRGLQRWHRGSWVIAWLEGGAV